MVVLAVDVRMGVVVELLVIDSVVVVVATDVVVAYGAEQKDSLPTAAKLILLRLRRAALFFNVSPVGVPVCGRLTLGLE